MGSAKECERGWEGGGCGMRSEGECEKVEGEEGVGEEGGCGEKALLRARGLSLSFEWKKENRKVGKARDKG